MERPEKKELRSIDYKSSFSKEQENYDYEDAIETESKEDNKQRPVKWELLILKQIIICTLIIILLGLLGNIPRIGPGIINRFRYVLKYGEEERPQYKIYSFARKQWDTIKDQVSSWFTVEIKEALAPPGKSIQFSAPLYNFEKREFFPSRVRFSLSPNSHVYASAPGTVREIQFENGGWKIRLDHGNGWSSIYYPCPKVYVDIGEWVKAYQEIACTSWEFYWEVHYGSEPVNPRPLLNQNTGSWY